MDIQSYKIARKTWLHVLATRWDRNRKEYQTALLRIRQKRPTASHS